MWACIAVIVGLVLVVAGLMGLVYLIEYLATHHPDTALGRICKAIDEAIGRLPED